MPSRARPLLAVLYDAGAVPAGEIGGGLADLGDIAFLVPPGSAHVAQLRPVMEQLGEVHALSGHAATDAELIQTLAPDAVFTFCEELIRPAAALAAAAGIPGPSERTARLFTDKGLQRQALKAAAVDETRVATMESPADWPGALESVGLPAIVKPVSASRSRDVHAVWDETDVPAVTARLADIASSGRWSPFIVEEFLHGRQCEPYGDYVSVESICTRSGLTHLVLTGKTPVMPPFRGTGRVWPSFLPPAEEQEIFDLVGRSLTAVGSDCGFTHTEVKLTPEGPRLLEINGRISGHINMMARESCGLDLVRIAALIALGEQPSLSTFDFGGKVHFQYNNLAPLRPCHLEDVRGAEIVRAMPGVSGYRYFVRPGDALPGGTATVTMDVISGVCNGQEEVARTIEAARAALSFRFRFAAGASWVRASDLSLY
jgi:biotin carboxylase